MALALKVSKVGALLGELDGQCRGLIGEFILLGPAAPIQPAVTTAMARATVNARAAASPDLFSSCGLNFLVRELTVANWLTSSRGRARGFSVTIDGRSIKALPAWRPPRSSEPVRGQLKGSWPWGWVSSPLSPARAS